MINQRSFGVEIECGSPWEYEPDYYEDENSKSPVGKTIKFLKDNNLPKWAENVYYDGTQIEIPSPILSGAHGMRQLMKVMNLLKKKGFYTTVEDGMHVHHDTSDLNFEQIQKIAETWYENQNLINRLVAAHRRNGHWCKNLDETDLDLIRKETELGAPIMTNYGDSRHNKYKSLSLYTRQHLGTIEIRLHEGTLDFAQAKAWILFGQAFITNIAQRKSPLKFKSVEEMMEKLRVRESARVTLLNRKG